MIAALRSGLGSFVDQLLGRTRSRIPPAPATDRQGRRAQPFHAPASEGALAIEGQQPGIHADLALRRFTAFALGASLGEIKDQDCDADLAALEPARHVLGKLELQAKYLPRRPSLLPRLMSSISSDSHSMRDLAKIIGDDGALLGGLLRLANSSFYRVVGAKPIDSLQKAVTLVGTDGIRSLVATALLHPVMTGSRGPFAGFAETTWEHSQCAAECAELHAAQVQGVDPFSARLLVLLHGLANNTVFRIAREECLTASVAVRPAALAKLLDDWVGPTALRIAENWRLPPELIRVLAEPGGNRLARSLRFGRLAGALLLMVNHGHMRELSARAIVLADDARRPQIDRLWSRLALTHLASAR
jgi:HD-like signal output (HDOD) protein